MHSIHKRTFSLACALAVSAVIVSASGGCQSKSTKGPFSDVTDRDRQNATMSQTPTNDATAQAAVQVTAAQQAAPPEPSEAARMADPQDARAPMTADNATAQMEREVRVMATPAGEMTPRQPAMGNMGDAVADRTGRPTTQGTNAIHIDEWGGARRDWSTSTSYRPSGDVLAGPTMWPHYVSRAGRPEWQLGWIEPVEFLGNTILLPFQAILTPAWKKVVYSSADAPISPAEIQSANPADNPMTAEGVGRGDVSEAGVMQASGRAQVGGGVKVVGSGGGGGR